MQHHDVRRLHVIRSGSDVHDAAVHAKAITAGSSLGASSSIAARRASFTARGPQVSYLTPTIQASEVVPAGSYTVQLNCWDAVTEQAVINRATLSVIATAT